jgi:HSP20 family molecular chaperone IbpA
MSESNLVSRENEGGRDDAALLPPVDVIEDAEGITLYADMPGVSKDKICVRVEADTLAIEGQVDLLPHQSLEVTHAEVQLPRYRRAFTLGPELNTASVAAEFRQGVLKLRIPKAEHAKPRRIEVQVS